MRGHSYLPTATRPKQGLDATAAQSAMALLRDAAHGRGLTALAIVHQPRPEIVAMIDDLILLARGGRPVYLGRMSYVQTYFSEHLGYGPCPLETSPLDWVIDVVEGKQGLPHKASAGACINATELAAALADAWRNGGTAWARKHADGESDDAVETLAILDTAAVLPAAPPAVINQVAPPRPGFLQQAFAFTRRGIVQHMRGSGFLFDCVSLLLGGCVMGIVACDTSLFIAPANYHYMDSCPPGAERYCKYFLRNKVEPITFYIVIAIGVLTVPPAVRVFGAEKDIYYREAATGISRLAYFTGKVIAESPKLAILAFAFAAPVLAIAPLRSPAGLFYLAVLVEMWLISAMSYILSGIFTSTDAANLFGVNTAVIACLFSGFVPLLGNGGFWCYSHWAQRAFIAIELSEGYALSTYLFNRSIAPEHRDPDWARDLWVLTLDGVACIVVAFATLCLRHRDKQR